MPEKFYPAISSLVNTDALPEQLGFVKDGIASLLSHLYFKDLQYTGNPRGDKAFYSLKIVSLKRISFDLPGTGFALVLNPSHTDPAHISEFPVTLDWEWPILAYVNQFRTEGFSFDGGAFYDLAVQILNLPAERMITEALATFYPDLSTADAATQFIATVSAHPDYSGTPFPAIPGVNHAQEIAGAIETTYAQNPSRLLFEVFLFSQGDDSVTVDKIIVLFGKLIGGSIIDLLKKLIIPKISATLSVAVGIEFPRSIFVPLDNSGNPITDENVKSFLTFSTSQPSFRFSTETGFGYSDEIQATLTPSQIGQTGIKISIEKAKLDLSREKNIAEADMDGRPKDFMGVYITKASIILPNFLNHDDAGSSAEIYATNLLAGTGGLSGTIGLRAKTPGTTNPLLLKANLGGGFELGFSGFDITFRQNQVTSSNIRGTLKVAGFKDAQNNDALINIVAHFDGNGNFSVTASEDQGIRALRIPNVLDLIVKSVSIGRQDGRFYLAVVGDVDFAAQSAPIGQFIPDKIEIQKLVIWEDGKFEIEGGKVTLPSALSLKIGPVKLSVTAIGLGSHQQEHNGVMRQYSYFSFDGGVNVNPGGVDVSGNGVAFYFTTDNDPLPLDVFMRIQSIKVDMIIPGSASKETAALTLKGFLSMQQATPPAKGTEYIGGIEFTLPKLKMGGSAAMRLNPDVPAFIIDAGLEMASPILLGSTGLGIYGFRGLLGLKYVASKAAVGLTDADPWWQYYKKKVAPDNKEGIQVSKFEQKDGFSLGAGISLATAPDGGRTFSSKIFFLLSLPEVFMLQGQGQILKQRIGLDVTQDPPFFALISISSTSIEAAFGVNYKIPDEGSNQGGIATIDGLMEMGFFWGNSSAWYLNVGKDTPESRRIQVKLLTLFNVYFYLMLSSSGIRAGAGASYSLKKSWGPLKAELSAYIDVAGRMSFRPKQLGASIQLGGTVEISIFGIGFGLSGDASLAAEAAKPFMIGGSLKVCVKILWKRFCGTFEFNWTFDPDLNEEELPFFKPDLSESAKALHMLSGETFNLYTSSSFTDTTSGAVVDNYMIPMDSYIDIEFLKSVKVASAVSTKIGTVFQGNKYVEYFPPQRAKSDRVRHEYQLENVEILYHNGSSWVPYDMYAAATPLQLAPFVVTDLSQLKYGYWQQQSPDEFTKLRIMAQSPLDYLSQGTGDILPGELGVTVEQLFCAPASVEETCAAFDEWLPGSMTPVPVAQNDLYFHSFFRFRVTGGNGDVIDRPAPGMIRALRAEENESIELYFNESYPHIRLFMRICSPTAEVSFYERILSPARADQPRYLYRRVETRPLTETGALTEILYKDLQRPIDKIIIRSGNCIPEIEPDNCETTVIAEKRILERFLEQLIKQQHFAKTEVRLLDDEFQTYDGVFFHTPLYDFPIDKQHTRYTVTENHPQRLTAVITDDNGFGCVFSFRLAEEAGGILWEHVTALKSFAVVKEHPVPGDNYSFVMELEVKGPRKGNTVVVYGESCYPLMTCGKKRNATAETVFDVVRSLAESGRLNAAFGKLNETEAAAYAKMSGVSAKSIAYYTETEAQNLSVRFIADGKPADVLHFVLPAANNDFRMEDVRELRNPIAEDKNVMTLDALTHTVGQQRQTRLQVVHEPAASKAAMRESSTVVKRDEVKADFPAQNCGDVCTDVLSPNAALLERYLNTLIVNSHLFQQPGNSVRLFPDHNSIYNGVFQNTALYYQNPPPQGRIIRHAVVALSAGHIVFKADDNNDFRCDMKLEVLSAPGRVTISSLLEITNLRLDPAYPVTGVMRHFIADAAFRSGKQIVYGTVRGESCYQLNECRKRCETLLYKVCVLSYTDAIINETNPPVASVQEDVDSIINGFNGSIRPIWRPNTRFAIRVTTKDNIYRENGSSLINNKHPQRQFTFGFRTTGVIGHFHQYTGPAGTQVYRSDYQALKDKDRQDEYKLAGLLHYVDFSKSYPNADGQLNSAKPLFYVDPKLLLFYLEQYVYEMLRSWDDITGSDGTDVVFEVKIKDPAPSPTAGEPDEIEAGWELSPLPIISQEVQVLNNMMTYGLPCVEVTTIDPTWVNSTFDIPDLRPLKLYTAIFSVRQKRNNQPAAAWITREVLRYGFQTSRYDSFTSQVNSYILRAAGGGMAQVNAVFRMEVTEYPEMVALAGHIVLDTLPKDHALLQDFGDPFNRMMDGVFRLQSLHPATTTEFNVVQDKMTSRIYGILVRNPEPFNDPKIPLTEMTDALHVSVNGMSAGLFKTIWSKDRSQAFVTRTDGSLTIPAGASVVFTFRYKQYNGSTYTVVSAVTTPSLSFPV